jgi:hypothetical protein
MRPRLWANHFLINNFYKHMTSLRSISTYGVFQQTLIKYMPDYKLLTQQTNNHEQEKRREQF